MCYRNAVAPITFPIRNGRAALSFQWNACQEDAAVFLNRPSRHPWGPCGCYFGRTLGSPPGLPGGGMTGVLPPPGGGVTSSRSIVCGGQMTPSDRDSLSLGFPPAWPRVSACERSVGSTSVVHRCWLEGACAGGDGRSCAPATATTRIEMDSAVTIPAGNSGSRMSPSDFILREQRLAPKAVPQEHDPETACPGRDPGWVPVSEKVVLQVTA